MNILILTSYFPPNTAIAAVRPYMFAKYLCKAGHRVTVLCPGCANNKNDGLLDDAGAGICVRSYLGKNANSALYEQIHSEAKPNKKLAFLPECIRMPMKKAYYKAKVPLNLIKRFSDLEKRMRLLKANIDDFQNEKFDIVFATYGNLENIYAGKYAAEKLNCRWVMDFRDPVAQRSAQSWLEYQIWKNVQKKAIQAADICTAVSKGVSKQIAAGTEKHVITLYNGYDPDISFSAKKRNDDILRFAYTGVLYDDKRSSSSSLFKAIKLLKDEGKLDIQKVQLEYAGPHFYALYDQAKVYGVESILINHGCVGRTEAAEIQIRCDIFLVLSWNTKYEQGVLTGKFFEGIRANKPILAIITGAEPNSELRTLNEEYHYGFCYEECCEAEQFELLYQWVESAYVQKQSGAAVSYRPEEKLLENFRYDRLAGQLEKICADLIDNR